MHWYGVARKWDLQSEYLLKNKNAGLIGSCHSLFRTILPILTKIKQKLALQECLVPWPQFSSKPEKPTRPHIFCRWLAEDCRLHRQHPEMKNSDYYLKTHQIIQKGPEENRSPQFNMQRSCISPPAQAYRNRDDHGLTHLFSDLQEP